MLGQLLCEAYSGDGVDTQEFESIARPYGRQQEVWILVIRLYIWTLQGYKAVLSADHGGDVGCAIQPGSPIRRHLGRRHSCSMRNYDNMDI